MSAQATPTATALGVATAGGTTPQGGTAYRHAVLLGLLAWLLVDSSTRAFATSLLRTLRELGLPADAEGLPGAVAGLTTTFAAIPAGWLADRITAKLLLLIALSLSIAASALALTGSAAMFGVVAFLNSLAIVLLPPVVVRLLQGVAHDLRGACLGIALGMSAGSSTSYFLLTFQLGEVSGWGWRAVYAVTLLATVLLATLVATTFRMPVTGTDTTPTLPARTVLHLSVATIALAALTGGVSQVAAKLLLDLQSSGNAMRHYSNILTLPIPLTVVAAIAVAFLHGQRARWIPRIAAGATGTCLVALLLAAALGSTATAWYALTVAQACGAFAFAAMLSTCACWAADHVRGLLTGVLFAAKQLLGAILGVVLFTLSSGVTLAGIALLMCSWSLWHARRAEQALHADDTAAHASC